MVSEWEHYNNHQLQAFCGLTALGGIILFLFVERFHNLFAKGHSAGHSHEPLTNMVIEVLVYIH